MDELESLRESVRRLTREAEVLAMNLNLTLNERDALREHLMLVFNDAEVFGWQSEWIGKARKLLGMEPGA